MADLRLTFELRLSQRVLRLGLSALLLAYCAPELASESVTLTTYYPAPSGVYTQMITTNNTYLARDTGNVGINTTNPTHKLDVTGDGNFTSNLTVGGVLTANNAITGPYGLIPSRADWATYGVGWGGAAIYNDGNSYQSLMIVGNNSGGSGIRRVGVWDNLEVHSNLYVDGSVYGPGGGTLNVGSAETVAGLLTANSGIKSNASVVAAPGGCFFVRWSSGGNQGLGCGGGWYVTNQSGYASEWMSAPAFMETNNGTDSVGGGEALCCPCGPAGCPW